MSRSLIGGVYGVCIGKFYSAESMFFKKDNASKYAIYELIKFLKSKEIEFLDIQMVTPTTEKLGAVEISRELFLKKLKTLVF